MYETRSATHSRRHERVRRDPIRARTEDPDVIYFEEPSESGLIDQLVLHDAHAAEPDLLSLAIQQLALLHR
jgi:hypothetical protein